MKETLIIKRNGDSQILKEEIFINWNKSHKGKSYCHFLEDMNIIQYQEIVISKLESGFDGVDVLLIFYFEPGNKPKERVKLITIRKDQINPIINFFFKNKILCDKK